MDISVIKTEQIIPLSKEGPWALRLVIRPSYGEGWIQFAIQQYREGKWITEQPIYAFESKYVKNIPSALIQVLEK